MNFSFVTQTASKIADTTKDYNKFDSLTKENGPLDVLGKILSSAIHVCQTYIYIPLGFTLLLVGICIWGGQKGRDYAKSKLLWAIIGVFAIMSIVGIIGLIISAFGGSTAHLSAVTGVEP